MVEPVALETCHTEQPPEASKLVRTRAQRIPSRSRAPAHIKTGYICADPTVILTFRLQQGGGPYIPDCRPLVPEQRNPHTGVSALVDPGGWIFQFSLSKKR